MRFLAFTLAIFMAAPAQTGPRPKAHSGHTTLEAKKGVVFWDMSRHYMDFLLRHIPQINPERLAELQQTFIDLGCPASHLREQTFAGGKNLLCTLPGEPFAHRSAIKKNTEAKTILFIANYEHDGAGQGAVDNWSGALMLPFVYHALTVTPRNHTFLFADVEGEAGAKALFNSLTLRQRHNIQGVIALDCLGLGPIQYYVNPYDSANNLHYNWLTHQLRQAALDQHLNAPLFAIPGGWFKVDVTRVFGYHNIQSVLLHSVAWKNRNLPGSARDTYVAIDYGIYYKNFAQLADYAAELDKSWPSLPGNKSSDSLHGKS